MFTEIVYKSSCEQNVKKSNNTTLFTSIARELPANYIMVVVIVSNSCKSFLIPCIEIKKSSSTQLYMDVLSQKTCQLMSVDI